MRKWTSGIPIGAPCESTHGRGQSISLLKGLRHKSADLPPCDDWRALAGLVPDDATEDKPVVVLGVLAYKKVSV